MSAFFYFNTRKVDIENEVIIEKVERFGHFEMQMLKTFLINICKDFDQPGYVGLCLVIYG